MIETSLRNVIGTQKNGGKNTKEILTGQRPNVKNLSIFGCEACMVNTSDKIKRVYSRAKIFILLRCLPHANYRVWDIVNKRVVHVRHVQFNKNILPVKKWKPREE